MIVDKIFGVFSMGKIKRLVFALIISLAGINCFAKQISFQIVQHDEAIENVSEQSLVIEDEILNNFFDYGFIVTNSSAQVSAENAKDEKLFKAGIGEAFNGFSDYFVQINLFYNRDENTKTVNADLKEIKFFVADAKTGVTFADKSIANVKQGNKKDDLKKISSNLVKEINNAIKANKA